MGVDTHSGLYSIPTAKRTLGAVAVNLVKSAVTHPRIYTIISWGGGGGGGLQGQGCPMVKSMEGIFHILEMLLGRNMDKQTIINRLSCDTIIENSGL